MPKKQFLRESKSKSKHAPKAPTTADEWLAEGVDFEEAGEKWRGGDATKSMRFFGKAIDAYETGLRNFPDSFDLAYNIARLRYEVTQYPKLLKQLPHGTWTLASLLQQALDSSRAAINLKADDADAQFNTGQILSSLAAEVAANSIFQGSEDTTSCSLLEEAVGFFNRCFAIQQAEFAKFEEQIASANASASSEQTETEDAKQPAAQGASSDITSQNQSGKEEQWVSVREPVTRNDVLDTIIALVETLSTLCSRSSRLGGGQAPKFLHTVEEIGTPTLREQLSSLSQLTERGLDGAIAQASLISAVSEAKYRMGLPGNDFEAYINNIKTAWSNIDLQNHAQGLWNRAETFTTASQAISDHDGQLGSGSSSTISKITKLQWEAYSLAATDLTTASKFRDDDNIGKIFITRGDIELLRAALGRGSNAFPAAQKNQEILIKNAEKYYRGAKVLTESSREKEENEEATVKEAVVKGLLGDSSALGAVRSSVGRMDEILRDAVNDGLFDEGLLASLPLNCEVTTYQGLALP
ncbi:TPR-like protein [Glarea lozoyensis ATCC 20868]|uniref:TPR-like protein n=1 Tax=Glarea lozoyensis (strain ATCC 20868 / MF5171) TaxID=1116229 RepID=S3D432_GLAL2|nr:TPR-like protein [Glarea lozoyensis ATCC 20868]EPE31874.1 TPR-like protein [Glarea lozoyensis ATCC 20868]